MSAIIVGERCRGQTVKGQRCKRRTLRSGLCWSHLEKEQKLKIKPSTIPGAQLGLFTTIPRARGNNVTQYTGEIVTTDRDHNRTDTGEPWRSQYGVQIKKNPPTFIDARRTNTAPGRFANTARNSGYQNNSQFVYDARNRQLNIRATKPIAPGHEILVPYGRSFQL